MDTFRNESLKYFIGFTGLIGIILGYAAVWSLGSGALSSQLLISTLNKQVWFATGFILLGVGFSSVMRKRSLIASSWLLCVSMTAAIFCFLLLFTDPFGVFVFIIPIIFAIILLDWKQTAFFLALVSAASLYINIVILKEPFFHVHVIMPVLILISITILVELILNELRGSYEWYQQRYQLALIKEQIIRDNEVKLEKLVNSLNEYKKDLTHTNLLLIKAKDEAEQARNVKQNFVQNVSHELRTPLNLIIGFSETMVNSPQSYGEVTWTPDLRGDIEVIHQNSQHLKALIDDVLDLAMLENKKYEVEIAETELNLLVQDVVLITESAYKSKNLYLEVSYDPDIHTVRADSIRIKQVLINLLGNALKYTKRGGVKITTKLQGKMAKVTVKDTGKGIPEEDLEKVFEAFYQVDKANNREDSGTGLGLSISKQLIELHGGEMYLTSSLGKGTTVTFTIPVGKEFLQSI